MVRVRDGITTEMADDVRVYLPASALNDSDGKEFAARERWVDHGDYTDCLAEISRLLKPRGKLVLLYEPTSPAYLYRLAYGWANKKRSGEGVDEDVLVVKELQPLASGTG